VGDPWAVNASGDGFAAAMAVDDTDLGGRPAEASSFNLNDRQARDVLPQERMTENGQALRRETRNRPTGGLHPDPGGHFTESR
jgi:hypothetical protein